MSEKKNIVEEGLEAIKTEVTTQLETKASLEAVQTIATDAKAHTDAVLKAATTKADERMDELEAKFAAMPAIKSDKQVETTMKYESDDSVMKFEMDVQKSYNDNTDVTGGRVDARGIIHSLEMGNFARTYGGLWNTTSGSIKIPLLSGIAFATEATVNTSRTQGGSLATTTVVIDNIVGSVQLSKPSIEDITDLDGNVMMLMMQEAAKKEAQDAVAVLKAGSFLETTTGAAAALPTATNIVGKLSDMKAAISSAYLSGARWYFSRELMSLVEKSNLGTGGDLNFDPVSGVRRLWGYEIVVVDYFPTGGTANDKAGFFGRMDRGLAFVSRKNLEVSRYMETSPGFVTYFGDLRSKSAVWDTKALVSLTTKV